MTMAAWFVDSTVLLVHYIKSVIHYILAYVIIFINVLCVSGCWWPSGGVVHGISLATKQQSSGAVHMKRREVSQIC